MKRLLTDLRRSARVLLCVSLYMWTCVPASAQRVTDNLDRGLVAVNMGGSTFLSWRILADEYFGVTYNVYRGETKIAEGLTVSNYTDSGTGTNYTVKAVVNEEEQNSSTVTIPWTQYVYNSNSSGFIDLPLSNVYNRDGVDVTDHYEPNDAEFADLDGDGQLEMIIKRLNTVDAAGVFTNTYADKNDKNGNPIPINRIYPYESKEFVVLDAYDIDWQTGATTLMWRIDCGPNMVSSNSTEINIIAYDWDGDGKAEVVLRGADNMIIYGNNGTTHLHDIGNMSANTRQEWLSHLKADGRDISSMAYTNDGAEYLLYLNGKTGELLQKMDYPLKRLESGENDLNAAWGDGYGHRSSKYFMGAPVLDGRSASLFLARGIYTRHKMIALDLRGGQWTESWRWNCNNSNSPWYGNGYHNFIIADVDEDGRDEIVYGSMVIDDSGKGLSTTGLGHGDAQHVGDFDPYRPGLEFFGCNEDNPGMNYRNATTSDIYIRKTADKDDGRALIGNFSSTIPGCIATSASTDLYSSVKDIVVATAPTDTRAALYWSQLNFRIYWDGDLGDEVLNSPGTAKEAAIIDHENGRIFQSNGCNMNNDSKNNPCFQGDLIGDWREEIVVRCGKNVRIYTSATATDFGMPSLWFDHQYRQAMVWQMMAYNQPPHVSYFMGELEGYTVAPPPLTTRGRTLFSSGGSVTPSDNGDLLMSGYGKQSYTISGNVSPRSIVINAPILVEGNDDNNNIQTTVYTHTLNIGSNSTIQGNTRFVKQGLGVLNISDATLTYSGNTDVWGGTVNFNGTMQSSPVWMNRHTTLNTTGGTFSGGLTMEYGATLNMGGETSGTVSAATVSNLTLNYGSQVVFDVVGTNMGDNDLLTVNGTLTIDKKTGGNWETYGPEHLVPVFVLRSSATLESGDYPIAVVEAFGNDADTDISNIKLNTDELECSGAELVYDSSTKILYLHIAENAMPAYGGDLSIDVTGMERTQVSATDYPSAANETFYLPIVSVTAPGFNSVTPTLSGKFTDLKSNVTDLGTSGSFSLYEQDYENATDASSWTNGGGTLELVSGDATYGNYIHHALTDANITGNRSAYMLFGNMDFTGVSQYNIEFDTRIRAGSVADRSVTDLVIMTNDATIPTTKSAGYAFDSEDHSNPINQTGSNYLFRMKAANSQVFTINDGTVTITLDASLWYHIKLSVDTEAKTVDYTITQAGTEKASGTFRVTTASCQPMGLFILDGRGTTADSKFDNIQIYYTKDFSSYTFTEPGMLTLKASVPGYKSKTETFTVPAVYYKYYESPDYSTLTKDNVQSVLGWNNAVLQSTRWANWNTTDKTNMDIVYSGDPSTSNSGIISGYVDNGNML